MPLSAGMALKNFLKASSPPAEAPMPTIGNAVPSFATVLPLASRRIALRERLRFPRSRRSRFAVLHDRGSQTYSPRTRAVNTARWALDGRARQRSDEDQLRPQSTQNVVRMGVRGVVALAALLGRNVR